MAAGVKTGGRVKGTPNKDHAQVKALALKHSRAAIDKLAKLIETAETESAQVAACKEILDRAIGKPSQGIGQADDLGPLQIKRIERVIK